MKRFLALGMVLASTAGLTAGDPVSVHPTPTSGLNQPLPTAIQSVAPAAPAPAVMSSNPSWLPGTVVPSGQPIPTVGPSYLSTTPTTNGYTDCATGVRPHYNLLSPPGWLSRRNNECGTCETRGSLWERFKAWVGYHPCDGEWRPSATPYRAPLRAYFSYPTCPIGGCNIPMTGGDCGPRHRHALGQGHGLGLGNGVGQGRGLRQGLMGGRPACDTGSCDTADSGGLLSIGSDVSVSGRPRVVYVPLSARADVGATYGTAEVRASRPSLLRRMVGYVTGDSLYGPCGGTGDCGFGSPDGGCAPPLPSPVHYAAPCAPPTATLRYARPTTPVLAPIPVTSPVTPPPALPAVQAAPTGKNISTTVPAVKVGQRPTTASQPFTNP